MVSYLYFRKIILLLPSSPIRRYGTIILYNRHITRPALVITYLCTSEESISQEMKSALVATAVAFVLCLSVETSFAQIINIGQCPEDVEVVQNFDVEAYLGQWYEISRYEQTFQRNGECTQAHYSVNDDGSVRVQNRQLVPPSSLFEQEIGRAVISFPDEDPLQAKLNVSFRGMRKWFLRGV